MIYNDVERRRGLPLKRLAVSSSRVQLSDSGFCVELQTVTVLLVNFIYCDVSRSTWSTLILDIFSEIKIMCQKRGLFEEF